MLATLFALVALALVGVLIYARTHPKSAVAADVTKAEAVAKADVAAVVAAGKADVAAVKADVIAAKADTVAAKAGL